MYNEQCCGPSKHNQVLSRHDQLVHLITGTAKETLNSEISQDDRYMFHNTELRTDFCGVELFGKYVLFHTPLYASLSPLRNYNNSI